MSPHKLVTQAGTSLIVLHDLETTARLHKFVKTTSWTRAYCSTHQCDVFWQQKYVYCNGYNFFRVIFCGTPVGSFLTMRQDLRLRWPSILLFQSMSNRGLIAPPLSCSSRSNKLGSGQSWIRWVTLIRPSSLIKDHLWLEIRINHSGIVCDSSLLRALGLHVWEHGVDSRSQWLPQLLRGPNINPKLKCAQTHFEVERWYWTIDGRHSMLSCKWWKDTNLSPGNFIMTVEMP